METKVKPKEISDDLMKYQFTFNRFNMLSDKQKLTVYNNIMYYFLEQNDCIQLKNKKVNYLWNYILPRLNKNGKSLISF